MTRAYRPRLWLTVPRAASRGRAPCTPGRRRWAGLRRRCRAGESTAGWRARSARPARRSARRRAWREAGRRASSRRGRRPSRRIRSAGGTAARRGATTERRAGRARRRRPTGSACTRPRPCCRAAGCVARRRRTPPRAGRRRTPARRTRRSTIRSACSSSARSHPPLRLGTAGQIVLGAAPAVDLRLAVGWARTGRQLDQFGGVGVQHSELDRAVARGRQFAAEHAPVGESHAAAQMGSAGPGGRGNRRGVAGGRLGLRSEDPHGVPTRVIGGRGARTCLAARRRRRQAAHRRSALGSPRPSSGSSRRPSWKACCSAA